jgi:DinB family protein
MKNADTKLSLSEILSQAEAISKKAQATFGQLNAEQINWKPNVESWSVGQCFDHLITTNRGFFPQVDQIIRGEKRTTLWQSMPFLPGFFGKMLINANNPNSNKKYKAPKSIQPSSSNVDPQIISQFAAQQNEVIDKMKATEGMGLEKIIIYSPLTKVVTYSLFDTYRIIVVHERRHFKQAQRVMEAPGFPK